MAASGVGGARLVGVNDPINADGPAAVAAAGFVAGFVAVNDLINADGPGAAGFVAGFVAVVGDGDGVVVAAESTEYFRLVKSAWSASRFHAAKLEPALTAREGALADKADAPVAAAAESSVQYFRLSCSASSAERFHSDAIVDGAGVVWWAVVGVGGRDASCW